MNDSSDLVNIEQLARNTLVCPLKGEALALFGQLCKLIGTPNLVWWLDQTNGTMFGMKPAWFFQAGTLEPIRKIVKQLSEPV